jgi:hypothetical protein
MAKTFADGDSVGIPCTVQQGPFPDEKLVTVETVEGVISGFVKLENLDVKDDEEHGLVRGTVVTINGDRATVKISGSFFTTAAGLAFVSRKRLRQLAA